MKNLVKTKRNHSDENSPEAIFLKCLFESLGNIGLPYAVMRNYESLPYSSGGSDLDIFVRHSDKSRAKFIVLKAVNDAGGVPIGLSNVNGFFQIHAFGRVQHSTMKWWGLCIDVYCGFYFKGIQILSEDTHFPVVEHNGICVFPEGLAGVLGVLKEILNNNKFPMRYSDAARKAATSDWEQIARLLHPMGIEVLNKFRDILCIDQANGASHGKLRKIRLALIRHAIIKTPLTSSWRWFKYEMYKLRRYLKPSGIVVAVLGVDGAGKSTVINGIVPFLNKATHNTVHIQHLRPGLLPPLSRLKGKSVAPDGITHDPHGSSPSGIIGSLFRLSYLSLDYILGYWFKTRFMVAKQPAIVIYDRYAYDMVFDPRRFRIGVPGRVAYFFARLAPRPDLIICLHAKPEVIAVRKQELPLEETKRQTKALLDFAKNEPRAVLVSNEGTVKEAQDTVMTTLKDFCSRRAKGFLQRGI